jgi:hypothetical protein
MIRDGVVILNIPLISTVGLPIPVTDVGCSRLKPRAPFSRHRPDLPVSTQQQQRMSSRTIGEQCRYGIGCYLVAALDDELVITERHRSFAEDAEAQVHWLPPLRSPENPRYRTVDVALRRGESQQTQGNGFRL